MPRKPTTYDVATMARVSQATVSYVLAGRADISIPERTRAHVLGAAHALGYRSNKLARALVLGKSQTIGLIVPQTGPADYYANIVQGICNKSACAGYNALMGYGEQDPMMAARQVNLLLEHQVEGIICIADEGTAAGLGRWIDNVAAEKLPCVIIDERTYSDRVDCVVSDDVPGIMEATRHLIRLGHRRIGHLSAGARMSTARDRSAGYRAAMAEAGLEVPAQAIIEGSYFQEEGARAAQKLLELSGSTAVVAASDLLALIAREEAGSRGLRVPGDIAIVGYGNTELAGPLKLTSVDQHPRVLGEIAADRLMQRLADRSVPPEEILVPTRLVVRQSCGEPQAPRDPLPVGW